MRYALAATLAAVWFFPSLARAQAPGSPAPSASLVEPVAADRLAQEAAEDLLLTKAFAGLQLSRDQLREILPLVADAQTRMQALERENAAAIGRHRDALVSARDQLLAGRTVSTRAEAQYAETIALAETKRTALRKDLVASLKRALSQQLGAQQQALMVQTARAVAFQERTAGYRLDLMTGNRGGGPINQIGRMMDRAREMSPEEFAQQQARMAQRRGGQAGPGGRDPQQMAAMMAQARSLPPNVYQQQRTDLALQFLDQAVNRSLNAAADTQAEFDRFIDRYFLSPRATSVVRRQLGMPDSPSGGE
jgi:hypothetical protein